MIELRNLSKSFGDGASKTWVANDLCATFPPRASVAILGRNGAGKSSLLRLIAGTMRPDRGEVRRQGTLSWPVGFAGSFHGDLSGVQNARFVARVYGVDAHDLISFVESFSQLGHHFRKPVRGYSSGMKSRLAFGVSMGIKFDTYLFDEITAVGDAGFRTKCEMVIKERLASSGAIVVTHSIGQVRRLCDHAAILENGRLNFFTDIERGIEYYQRLVSGAA